MALDLYHHGSSACAAKVRFALAEKQLPWTSRYVDILKGEQFGPEFLALNPKAVVPVLVHDGDVIVESTVICEYLEETFPANPIYPKLPLERARVREWTKAVDEELHPACSASSGSKLRGRRTRSGSTTRTFARWTRCCATPLGSSANVSRWPTSR